MTVRIASYNIHKCLGLDRRRSEHRIMEVLAEVDADIVALQEVDHRLGPRKAALPRALIAAASDYVAPEFALNGVSLGWHGQSILVRRGLAVTRLQRIELPGLEPRGAILTEIEGPEGALRVVGVHLGLVRRYRLMQMAAVRAAISHHGDVPTVILGDFNEWSARGGMAPLSDGFRVHAPGRSYPAMRPVAALDRIAVGAGLHMIHAGVHASKLARVASDHLPVWAEVRMDAKPSPAPAPSAS